MTKLSCLESYIDRDQNHYGVFLIEPLEIGQGITLGNALRRTLLSDLTGFAITGVRINNLKHEFSVLDFLREDTLEILLNLKEIIFKSSFSFKDKIYQEENLKLKGFLNTKGPKIVTAGMLKLPKNSLKIINPNQYICTITNDSEFFLEIDIEHGKGYRILEENKKLRNIENISFKRPSTLVIDAIFMPIRKVNYKIKLIHDTKGNIKESLTIEVLTNGSLTPKRGIQEGIKILLNLFYPLLINKNFLFLSSEYN